MKTLAQAVLEYVRKQRLLNAGDRVGVAVSGGADSVALLRVMLELQRELGAVLSVVHFDHKLRGAESDADQQFAAELAAKHKLELTCDSGNVAEYAAKKRLSLETAAREMRYAYFERLLAETSLDRIATAHTLDDQAETVLMRLIRGTGMRGLGGIHPEIIVKNAGEEVCGTIVRPMLGVRRRELQRYLAGLAQAWREDSTNADVKYTRNRVRHILMPLLEREFNPAIAERFSEFGEIAREDEKAWRKESNKLIGPMMRLSTPEWAHGVYMGFAPPVSPAVVPDAKVLEKVKEPGPWLMNVALDLEKLLAQPVSVQRRILQFFENAFMPLEFRHVEAILQLVGDESKEGKELRLPYGWTAVRRGKELQFLTPDQRERIPTDYAYEFPVPGTVTVWEANVVLEALIIPRSANTEDKEELLDTGLTEKGLCVRNWQPGDRFWPAHTKSPCKIKELLQDRHVTGENKKLWPVVASGSEIVWVRGLRPPAHLRPKRGSREALLIRESRPMEESQYS